MSDHRILDQALSTYSGAFRDPSVITDMLRKASRLCHLISPATSCATVSEGFVVAFSAVLVDVEHETFQPTGGGGDDDDQGGGRRGKQPGDKLALTRSAIERIALAAGVSWDAQQSRRLDNGKDPHYCRYAAVGRYPLFDGREVDIQDVKEIDLRDGSDYVQQMRDQAEAWNRANPNAHRRRSAERRIQNERIHIQSFCATKARLRAVRTLGIRSWYRRDDLEQKPFVVVQSAFTGASSDPMLAREFALIVAAKHLRVTPALYGRGPREESLPIAKDAADPPPVKATKADPSDLDVDNDVLACNVCGGVDDSVRGTRLGLMCAECIAREGDAKAYPAPGPTPPTQGASAPAASSPSPPPRAGAAVSGARSPGPAKAGRPTSEHVLPGGNYRGWPLNEVPMDALAYWMSRVDDGLCAGTFPEHREKNEALLEAIREEIAWREEQGAPGSTTEFRRKEGAAQ